MIWSYSCRIFLLMVVALALPSTALKSHESNYCSDGQDYSPCTCSGTSITCTEVEMTEVRKVFIRTKKTIMELNWLDLVLAPGDEVIPDDLLSDKRVSGLALWCPTNAPSLHQLRVDRNAFRSTQNLTAKVLINYCDTSLLDFVFLTEFDKLNYFGIRYSSNVQLSLPTLPVLNGLSTLDITYSSGLDEWNSFPTLARGLISLHLDYNLDINDQAISRILNWILTSSADSLQELSIQSNSLLTIIPRQISSFRKLNDLDFSNNRIPVVSSGSLSFASQLQRLYLSFTGINTIESGAFQGILRGSQIFLQENNLTRFEGPVFQPVLQQLPLSPVPGFIDVTGNPFDCDSDPCHLAWLTRDNRNLFYYIQGGACSNGTYFYQLDPSEFVNCPKKTGSRLGGVKNMNKSQQSLFQWLSSIMAVTFAFF